jgi:quinoprotein glucose dehydrogenase
MVDIDESESAKAGEGAFIYQVNCAVCHGADRQGDPTGTYPGLEKVAAKFANEQIQNLIRRGKGFMPSFSSLKERQMNALVSFLVSKNSQQAISPENAGINVAEVPYTFTGYNRFVDKTGYPAVKPPWGTLTAIDLNKGIIIWQVPLGEYPELTAKGIPITGTENYGGPVITAGGLVFIGASKDEYFRAIDKDTGRELWKYKLPAGGYATPAVYEAGGREYVVIACGGGKMGTLSGDQYIAFALKREKK